MKKSILALAALGAFAGAASAQSSVTLYGRVEANGTYSKPGDNINRGDASWRMYDGGAASGIGGSRWGLRGTEDLGGGLRAYFQLESAFNLDTGSDGNVNANTGAVSSTGTTSGLFGRQAYVALGSKTLGDVRMGRQESISRIINGQFSDVSVLGEMKIDEGVLATAANTSTALFQTFGQRVNNSLAYISPNLGGFQLQAMVGAGEGSTARYQGVMGSYKNGPLAVAVGYEEYDSFGARTSSYNKVIHVGANYNFGVATLFAGFQNSTDVGSNLGPALTATSIQDQKAYTVGVMVPINSFQLRANYTKADYDLVNGSTEDIQKYGVSVRYLLSKRTTLYSAFTERKGSSSALTSRFNDQNFVQKREFTVLGLAHTF